MDIVHDRIATWGNAGVVCLGEGFSRYAQPPSVAGQTLICSLQTRQTHAVSPTSPCRCCPASQVPMGGSRDVWTLCPFSRSRRRMSDVKPTSNAVMVSVWPQMRLPSFCVSQWTEKSSYGEDRGQRFGKNVRESVLGGVQLNDVWIL